MANVTRKEAQSTDFWNSGNWDAALSANSDLGIGYTTGPLTANLTGVTTLFNSLVVQNGVSAPIGAATTPLEIDLGGAATNLFQYLGASNVYVKFLNACLNVEWSPSQAATMTVSGGTLTNVRLAAGTASFGAAVDFTSAALRVSGGDVTVEKDTAGTDVIDSVYVNGGTLRLRRDFTALEVSGDGVVVWEGDALTGGTVRLTSPNARFEHRSGNLGAVTVERGLYDVSKLVKSATIASLTLEEGSRYAPAVGARTLTITGGTTEKGRGAVRLGGRA